MRTSDFDYHLPPELIAQTPIEPRDAARLLVIHRDSGQLEHTQFSRVGDYLREGDALVFNQSRVIPARIRGLRAETGGQVELFLLRQESPGVWQALGKPGRRLRPGETVTLILDTGATLRFEVLAASAEGVRTVRLPADAPLEQLGEVPLPPYIHARLADPERYQTVYARLPGSVAAPTAGLHFTQPLLEELRRKGVEPVFLTLHVGLDTFRPVQEDDPAEHKIHTEYYELDGLAAAALNAARRQGRRIIAVGTTSVRTLEQAALRMEQLGQTELEPQRGQAELFILPGHRFRLVDAMLTNFHLPRSTLLMLVSAFAGKELIQRAYAEAIAQRYRFYSFGDATLMV